VRGATAPQAKNYTKPAIVLGTLNCAPRHLLGSLATDEANCADVSHYYPKLAQRLPVVTEPQRTEEFVRRITQLDFAVPLCTLFDIGKMMGRMARKMGRFEVIVALHPVHGLVSVAPRQC
jgi:hypothetical protein